MKALGLALLSFIPILLGYQKRAQILMVGKIRVAMISFLESLRFEIDCFSRSQEEIFHRFESAPLEKCGFLPLLREEVHKDPCGALKRALPLLQKEGFYQQKEWESLEEFGENFGMQSKTTQLQDCDKLLLILKKEEETAEQKRMNDASVARTCGLCVGIGIFILFL